MSDKRCRIECPQCHKKLVLARRPKPGDVGNCPACHKKITLQVAPVNALATIKIKQPPAPPSAPSLLSAASRGSSIAIKPIRRNLKQTRRRDMVTATIITTASVLGVAVLLTMMYFLLKPSGVASPGLSNRFLAIFLVLIETLVPLSICGVFAVYFIFIIRINWATRPRLARHVMHGTLFVGPTVCSLLYFFLMNLFGLGLKNDSFSHLSGSLEILSIVMSCFLCPWIPLGYWPARWLTPYALGFLIKSIRCPGCGEVLPTIAKWTCGCGYVSHKATNIFINKCPSCRALVGHTSCPRCNVTILM